jgi:hypothetical protein
MADIAGYLIPSSTTSSSYPDQRVSGCLVSTTTTFSSGLPNKRRDAYVLPINSGGGGTVTIYYQKRARDLGPGSPVVYTEWVSTDINSVPSAIPPYGGPWGEIVILAQWQ